MDYMSYRKKYFIEPAPEARFDYAGLLGVTLYFQVYEEAVAYYQRVLGPPAYVEGKDTKGWRLGDTWLTLLRGGEDHPRNVEVQLVMRSPEEAERLQQAFVDAGGTGRPPTDALMYEPIRACPVTDPFGTEILIYSRLED